MLLPQLECWNRSRASRLQVVTLDARVTYEKAGRRLLAGVIDAAVIFALIVALVLLRFALEGDGLPASASREDPSGFGFQGPLLLAMICSAQTLFWSFLAATPGMLLVGCQVVRGDNGERLSLARSLARCAGLWLGLACFGIGVLWSIWDSRHQGLHDKLVGSVVVREDESLMALDELLGMVK